LVKTSSFYTADDFAHQSFFKTKLEIIKCCDFQQMEWQGVIKKSYISRLKNALVFQQKNTLLKIDKNLRFTHTQGILKIFRIHRYI
jgi:hypothetical protein